MLYFVIFMLDFYLNVLFSKDIPGIKKKFNFEKKATLNRIHRSQIKPKYWNYILQYKNDFFQNIL